jgi:hypothetical protein
MGLVRRPIRIAEDIVLTTFVLGVAAVVRAAMMVRQARILL